MARQVAVHDTSRVNASVLVQAKRMELDSTLYNVLCAWLNSGKTPTVNYDIISREGHY